MKITYVSKDFSDAHQEIIDKADQIMTSFEARGFDLSLRQLYYQFVAKALIPNTEQSYKRLGVIMNKARLAGQIDWNQLVDRGRGLKGNRTWIDPESIIRAVASSYRLDHWVGQDFRIEVWIEKEALIGVIQRVCKELDVDYFACKGYNSQSEMWRYL